MGRKYRLNGNWGPNRGNGHCFCWALLSMCHSCKTTFVHSVVPRPSKPSVVSCSTYFRTANNKWRGHTTYVCCLSSSPQQPVSAICGYSNSYFLQEGLGSCSFMDPQYTVHVFHAVLGHWYPYTIHRSESAMHYLAISIVTDCSLISDPLED